MRPGMGRYRPVSGVKRQATALTSLLGFFVRPLRSNGGQELEEFTESDDKAIANLLRAKCPRQNAKARHGRQVHAYLRKTYLTAEKPIAFGKILAPLKE